MSYVVAFRGHTHAPAIFHKHFVLDPLIAIDGDRASVESYFVRIDKDDDGPYLRVYGRYLDAFVRCADCKWRIQKRVETSKEPARKPRPGGPPGMAEQLFDTDQG